MPDSFWHKLGAEMFWDIVREVPWFEIVSVATSLTALFFAVRYWKRKRHIDRVYKNWKAKSNTELDLELATAEQLVHELLERPDKTVILIMPKGEEQVEVHVRNASAFEVCNLLATAQLVVLNQPDDDEDLDDLDEEDDD